MKGIWKGRKIAKNHTQTVSYKIKYAKTIPGPIRSFTVKEKHIGSADSEILRYKQTDILLLSYKVILDLGDVISVTGVVKVVAEESSLQGK